MDLKTIGQAITQIAEEKGIAREQLIEAIELALASAFKREAGRKAQHIRAEFNPKTGDIKLWQMKLVVTEDMLKPEIAPGETKETSEEAKKGVKGESEHEALSEGEKKIRFHPERHIKLDEALLIRPDTRAGDEIPFPIEAKLTFGHIAAQTAKQVILQRIREIERAVLFKEFKNREGEVISGVVERTQNDRAFINFGKATGMLPLEEMIPNERVRQGERIKVFVTQVREDVKGTTILLSRVHPKLVSKLFQLEVPEIQQGVVEIKLIAREAGARSKIAVRSTEQAVDPVGACVGQKGSRVSAVMSELSGEKIDIIPWSDDPVTFVKNAMAPARINKVESVDKRKREIQLSVPPEELSLAIGRGGQNVRLAAKLTGWKIEVVGGDTRVSSGDDVKEMKAVEEAKEEKTGNEEVAGEESPDKETGSEGVASE